MSRFSRDYSFTRQSQRQRSGFGRPQSFSFSKQFDIVPRCSPLKPIADDDELLRATSPDQEDPAELASMSLSLIEEIGRIKAAIRTEESQTEAQKRLLAAQNRQDQLIEEIATLELRLDDKTRQRDLIQRDAVSGTSKEQELRSAKEFLGSYEQSLDSAQAEVLTLRTEREHLSDQLHTARDDNQEQKRLLLGELRDAQRSSEQLRVRYDEQFAALNRELGNQADTNFKLREANSHLQTENGHLQTRSRALEAQLEDVQTRYEAQAKQAQLLKAEIAQLLAAPTKRKNRTKRN